MWRLEVGEVRSSNDQLPDGIPRPPGLGTRTEEEGMQRASCGAGQLRYCTLLCRVTVPAH